MRRTTLVLTGLACALMASAATAAPYEIDPLTGQPIAYTQAPAQPPQAGYRGGDAAQPSYAAQAGYAAQPQQSAYEPQPAYAAPQGSAYQAQPAYAPQGSAYQGQPGYDPYQGQSGYQPQAAPIPRQLVTYASYGAGTVVVNTNERRLYYVLGGGQAVQYGIGVGRPGFTWGGSKTITMKREWPDWRPPAQMLRRRPDLPRYMAGGVDNPLGARAMYLGGSLYRIHGSNEPETIGQAVSSGCIRMTNDDVTDLYSRVRVGTRVVVLR